MKTKLFSLLILLACVGCSGGEKTPVNFTKSPGKNKPDPTPNRDEYKDFIAKSDSYNNAVLALAKANCRPDYCPLATYPQVRAQYDQVFAVVSQGRKILEEYKSGKAGDQDISLSLVRLRTINADFEKYAAGMKSKTLAGDAYIAQIESMLPKFRAELARIKAKSLEDGCHWEDPASPTCGPNTGDPQSVSDLRNLLATELLLKKCAAAYEPVIKLYFDGDFDYAEFKSLDLEYKNFSVKAQNLNRRFGEQADLAVEQEQIKIAANISQGGNKIVFLKGRPLERNGDSAAILREAEIRISQSKDLERTYPEMKSELASRAVDIVYVNDSYPKAYEENTAFDYAPASMRALHIAISVNNVKASQEMIENLPTKYDQRWIKREKLLAQLSSSLEKPAPAAEGKAGKLGIAVDITFSKEFLAWLVTEEKIGDLLPFLANIQSLRQNLGVWIDYAAKKNPGLTFSGMEKIIFKDKASWFASDGKAGPIPDRHFGLIFQNTKAELTNATYSIDMAGLKTVIDDFFLKIANAK